MKSITIHNLEDPLNTLLRKKARQQGTSLNKTVKSLLEESLGIASTESTSHKDDFVDFCGVWSAKEVEEFEKALGDLEKIDQEDWV